MIDQYPLGELSAERFLAEYWHKKPLLIRNACPDFEPPITPDELAGLACESEVESRLIQFNPNSGDWQLEHGPFDDSRFGSLPEQHWTLLVQAVDHWVPEAADLVQRFNFIPNWRVDDLMISYAVDGGGVGPHYDNYDVFLLQASGVRRWELGPICNEHSPRRDDTPVMILPQWEPEQVMHLEAGDMLYLPPCIAHNGVAEGDDCMTLSIGFRAPAHNEILRSFSDFVGEKLGRETRYADPELPLQDNPGEISAAALGQVRTILQQYLQDESLLTNWFGRYMTDPKYPELQSEGEELTDDELAGWLEEGNGLTRNEGARLAFIENGDGTLQLFADGRAYPCTGSTAQLARALCAQRHYRPQQLPDAEARTLLLELIATGTLYLEDE